MKQNNNNAVDSNPIPENTSKKRDNYLSWDQHFMTVACVSAMRSKDPHTQVCICLTNPFLDIYLRCSSLNKSSAMVKNKDTPKPHTNKLSVFESF